MDGSRRRHSPSPIATSSRNGSRSPYHADRLPVVQPQASTSRIPSSSLSSALTDCLSAFLQTMIPQAGEYGEKEALRVKLETLAQRVLPGVKLKPFGSTANGLSLRNSDMDLCCLSPTESDTSRSAADLVEALGTGIQQQTDYMVKMLPRARIPIIKLGIPSSPNSPFGMSCDIGFGNRLALQNTRLLLSYVQLDPRVRPMILLIKVWTKRRKINNPYLGTLSSYGYALLVLAFLIHVRKPAVLPNLQTFPPTHRIPIENLEIDGHDVYFNDNTTAVKRLFGTPNSDNLADLLVAFFQYYAREFRYSWDVVSIRHDAGFISKGEKGWLRDNEAQTELFGGSRDLNRLCIEDPFQIDYNVARTVTRDGLYTIRGEFMRAMRTLQSRNDNLQQLIAELCEERAEEALVVQPPGFGGTRRVSAPSPRLAPVSSMSGTVSIPQSASDFRQWVEANSDLSGFSVDSSGHLTLSRSAVSESGDASPTLPPLGPPRMPQQQHFDPRTMSYRNGSTGSQYQPLRGPPRVSRGPSSPPIIERRLSWDGPRPDRRSSSQSARIARSMHGVVAQTAPASPLLGAEDASRPYSQPRSPSGSSFDRRHQSTHVNGISQAVAASPTASELSFSASPIRFGNFDALHQSGNANNGLGLFGAAGYAEDDDFDADVLRSSSSGMGSERSAPVSVLNDVILFGDLPVEDSSMASLRRSGSGAVSPDEAIADEDEPTAAVASLPSASSSFAAVASGRPSQTSDVRPNTTGERL